MRSIISQRKASVKGKTMINVGDLHEFARSFGRWLYRVNPKLSAEQFNTMIQQFVQTAPIEVGEHWSMGVDEFVQEAAKGYTPEENSFE